MQNSIIRQRTPVLVVQMWIYEKEESLTIGYISPHRSLSSATEKCNRGHIGCTYQSINQTRE